MTQNSGIDTQRVTMVSVILLYHATKTTFHIQRYLLCQKLHAAQWEKLGKNAEKINKMINNASSACTCITM